MAKSPSGEYRASSARGEVFYRDQIGLRLVGPIVGGIGWTRIAVRLVPVWLRRLLPVLVPVGGFMIRQRRVRISPWELSSGCLLSEL